VEALLAGLPDGAAPVGEAGLEGLLGDGRGDAGEGLGDLEAKEAAQEPEAKAPAEQEAGKDRGRQGRGNLAEGGGGGGPHPEARPPGGAGLDELAQRGQCTLRVHLAETLGGAGLDFRVGIAEGLEQDVL
jgi:hypothetical protein